MTSRSLEIDAGNDEIFTVEQLNDREWQSVFPTRLADKSHIHFSEEAAWRYVHAYINLERSSADTSLRTFEIVSEAIVTQRHIVDATSFEEALQMWRDELAALEHEETHSRSDPQVIDRKTGAYKLFTPDQD